MLTLTLWSMITHIFTLVEFKNNQKVKHKSLFLTKKCKDDKALLLKFTDYNLKGSPDTHIFHVKTFFLYI